MADSERRAHFDPHPHQRESLLLLAPPADDGAAAYCRDHLVPGATHEAAPIIVLSDPAAERSADWDDDGRSGVVIAVGDSTRSATDDAGASVDSRATAASGAPTAPSSPPETVLATGDLGSIGRIVDDYVTDWSASGHRPIVCVDSLSGLVDRASIAGVYRFLYVLLYRVERAGGSVHVHADPRVYEEEILRTFFPLFDRVVSFREGGVPH